MRTPVSLIENSNTHRRHLGSRRHAVGAPTPQSCNSFCPSPNNLRSNSLSVLKEKPLDDRILSVRPLRGAKARRPRSLQDRWGNAMTSDLESDLLVVLYDVARQMRTVVDQIAREHGRTRAQWIILLRLEREPGLSQNELAAIAEVAPITIARLVDRLEECGLAERRPDPQDRRECQTVPRRGAALDDQGRRPRGVENHGRRPVQDERESEHQPARGAPGGRR